VGKIIGRQIKEVAESKGFSQESLGKRISRTKQGVASIYKRATIDVLLLQDICKVLDYDFFAHLYEHEPLKSFKQLETKEFYAKIDSLNNTLLLKEELLNQKQELVDTQRKLILELEEKLKKGV
jgi:transcriptional regulator with XRE-family HTH domain